MKSKATLCVVVCLFLGLGIPRAIAQSSYIPTGSTMVFPHLGNGVQTNGVWTTKFIFLNNSPSMTQGVLVFYDDNGNVLSLGTDQGTNSDFSITIPAHGIYSIETNGTGALVMGSAFAYFDHAVTGTSVFSFGTAQGQMTRVGVLSRLPMTAFVTPAEARTGIAIANPYGWSTQVEVDAYDTNGTQAGTTTLTVPPGGHVAKNVYAFFPQLPLTFTGSVKIRSLDSWVSCLAIGFSSNSLFDPAYSVSAISYDELYTSYTGTGMTLYGPDAGEMSTVKADGLEQFSSNLFTGTLTSYNTTLGMTFSGPFIGNEDDWGILYSFSFILSGIDYPGWAIAYLNGDTIVGYVVDDGAGNFGTFTLDPVSGSGSTIVKRSMRRTGKLSDYMAGPRIERLLPPKSQ
jgi:hypothetical protein